MNFAINNIFSKRETEEDKRGSWEPTMPSSIPNSRQEGETYEHWGKRICAVVDGNSYAFAAYLHNVYDYSYKEQMNDKERQDEYKREREKQILLVENEIEEKDAQIKTSHEKSDDLQSRLVELKDEKKELENSAYNENKEAKVKMLIGIVILVPLTIYLFLFYSSTFFSAFFRNFEDGMSVFQAMFDSQALSKSLEAGITQFGFVICAPIIFLGLGFALHFISKNESRIKYLKMAALICVTFLFDVILAYLIGKHLHEMEVISGTAALGSVYGIGDAATDVNFWAVIFCGFIVYIIWGIVFDMVMSAYNDLDLNTINIQAVKEKILTAQRNMEEEKQKREELKKEIANAKNEIVCLKRGLNDTFYIDNAIIRTRMNDFHSGWVTQMKVLQMSLSQMNAVKDVYDETMNALLGNEDVK